MKTLHSGSSSVSSGTAPEVDFSWTFQEADDHEHPYLLTVKVSDQTHSEGYPQRLGDAEAMAKATQLARDLCAVH